MDRRTRAVVKEPPSATQRRTDKAPVTNYAIYIAVIQGQILPTQVSHVQEWHVRHLIGIVFKTFLLQGGLHIYLYATVDTTLQSTGMCLEFILVIGYEA